MSHKKGIDKKLLSGSAQGFNSQFLNLFGFSISESFLWCINEKIWTHLGKVMEVFRRRMCLCSVQIEQKNNCSISEMLLCHTVSEIRH